MNIKRRKRVAVRGYSCSLRGLGVVGGALGLSLSTSWGAALRGLQHLSKGTPGQEADGDVRP